MSSDGVQKRPQTAKSAARNKFESMPFDKFDAVILEHQASEESPKTTKKASKTTPGSLLEPFKRKGQFFVLNNLRNGCKIKLPK